MQEKYGFIYIWYDRKHKKYYIGSHWGTENDGYICSSRNMKKNYKRRPQDFKRRIVERVTTDRKELLETEDKWLQLATKNPTRYYNKNFKTGGYWWLNEKTKKEVAKKVSEGNKGKVPWIKGKTHSKETRRKIKEARSKQVISHSEETRRKISKAHKGKKVSEETRRKISINSRNMSQETKDKIGMGAKGRIPWNKGISGSIKHSDETKEKIRQTSLGRNHSEETKKKLSKIFTGKNHGNYGKHWYTNGIKNYLVRPENVPDGFYRGRTNT